MVFRKAGQKFAQYVQKMMSTAVWLENKHGKTNKTTWLCMKNNNLKKNHSMEQQITTTRIKKKKSWAKLWSKWQTKKFKCCQTWVWLLPQPLTGSITLGNLKHSYLHISLLKWLKLYSFPLICLSENRLGKEAWHMEGTQY